MTAVRKIGREKGFVVERVPIPKVGSHDVLVQVEAASVCGTDLHLWKWDEWAAQRIKPPLTVGHEFAGTVVEVGESVEHAKVGDYVSAESHVTCGMCFQCRTGQAHMCPQTKILGIDRDGAFAEYISIPEKVVWQNDRSKLPPEIATLQEPFGNAVFSTLAHDLAGQSVAVLGCGPVGLFSISIAKASGASNVLATDINDYRLGLAKTLGAKTFNPRNNPTKMETWKWLVQANEGFGVDIVLEMSGAPLAIDDAFKAVRNGGRVTLFGIPSAPVKIDVAESMIFKNLTVLALNGRRIFDTWYRTRWLLESGVVDLRPLITHQMGLEDVNKAAGLLDGGEACKIILRPKPDGKKVSGSTSGTSDTDANVRGHLMHR
ncbi:MAG: L-threonine 3-dehydrogenase [SAR202 cluster bacterium]|nr:L-threonine 3-dehydrogenase [SAR202 cluster bacterium]